MGVIRGSAIVCSILASFFNCECLVLDNDLIFS